MSLFAELKRRNVFRMAAFYVVASWLILQVGELLFEALAVPSWGLKLVLGLLILGFPITIMIAWVYEVTEEGVKKQSEVDRDKSITHQTGRRLDIMTIVLLVGVAGLFLIDRLAPVEDPAELKPVSAADERETPESHDDSEATSAKPSIAVLPFSNMSPDANNEYFADGITEELLNTLVKIPGILVAARTSAFSYKGQNKDVRVIGEELGVDHIVEGSVRKAGNDLRITAQLIRVSDGFHLWSETYDRKLENIFAIQEEIATQIAEALQAPLGLETELVSNRTANVANYDRYLEARQHLRARDLEPAIDILRDVVVREPDFAPAWAYLAVALDTLPGYQSTLDGEPIDFGELAAFAETAARKATELDPRSPDAYHALGNAVRARGQWSEARQAYERALALDAESIELLEDWRQLQNTLGYVDRAVEIGRRGYELEPQSPLALITFAETLYLAREYDRALELAHDARERSPDFTWPFYLMAEIAMIRGDFETAHEIFAGCKGCARLAAYDEEVVALAALAAGEKPQYDPALILESQYGRLIYELGGIDLMLDALEQNAKRISQGENVFNIAYFNQPFMDEVRTHPRYKAIVKTYGFPDYWREHGWPDYCWPVGEDDFECGAFQL